MSRIDDLISKLAPQGVEHKTVGEITTKGSNIKWANAHDVEAQYIDLTSVDRVTRKIGDTVTITADTAPSRAQQIVRTGDVLFATTRPTQMRWTVIPPEYDGQIASTGYCVLRPNTSIVVANYLAHTLGTDAFRQYIEANQVAGNYPSIPDRRVRAFRIPVPPLEVQGEIVRILDSFTALETELEGELEAELEARRRQYASYRDQLMAFPGAEQVRRIPMGEALSLRAGKFVAATDISAVKDEIHPYPCYGGAGLRGFVATANQDGEHVLIGRQGAWSGNVKRVTGKFYATEHAVVVSPVLDFDISWLFHELTAMNLNQYVSQGAQPGLAVGNLHKILLPVPDVGEQVRVGGILDTFDALVNDLSIALRAELNARRKQYEYYRDKLLAFEEVGA